MVAFVVPSLLAIHSKHALQRQGLPTTTYYTCILTNNINIYATLCLGVFLVIFVIISLVVVGSPM